MYNHVRLAASVVYLEAAEEALRLRLAELVGRVGADGSVDHDPYTFLRPAETWQRIKLPAQYECVQKRRSTGGQKTVCGMSRCLLCTVSTGAGSPDPRGAHRILAMMVASLDLTPAPTAGPEEGVP